MPASTDWPRLVSLAVHELRSPVNVIGGYLKMLRDHRAHPPDDYQRQLIDLALSSWSRTVALLADLSEIGKLEGGAAALHLFDVDIDQVLDAVVREFESPPDVSVTAQRRGLGGRRARGHPDRLRRALSACVMALARELPSDGCIVLEVRPPAPDSRVPIIVAEEGLLAALSDAEEGWTQLDEWRGGMGLELPLGRRIVELAGGRVRSPIGERRPAIRCDLPPPEGRDGG